MEIPIEYFYGETLRWSFGFENPNKAAVLFACAVPLLWWLWQMAWRLKNRWLKGSALVSSAGLLLAAWYCLIMTFSRGGLVAAGAALVYLIGWSAWNGRAQMKRWPRSLTVLLSILLLGALSGATLWNGLGERSAEALGKDASVGNRIELWSGALQMAAENPAGFGSGKSGEQYMLWYQPLDRHEGYRTMVNSYLTFLVEQGWWRTLAIAVCFTAFWVWTRPAAGETATAALRASLVAFATAGIFSTTMEDWHLWLLPATCVAVLLVMALRQTKRCGIRPLLGMEAMAMAGAAALFLVGRSSSANDPLVREFGEADGLTGVTAAGPSGSKGRSLGCLVDESVLGAQPTRLLRELALAADVKILLGPRVGDAELILCTGSRVHSSGDYPLKPLTLLAPETIPEADLAALAARALPLKILLPEIDEDGRVGFWTDAAEGALAANFHKTDLTGVGNRVDWAWAQVIELVKNDGTAQR